MCVLEPTLSSHSNSSTLSQPGSGWSQFSKYTDVHGMHSAAANQGTEVEWDPDTQTYVLPSKAPCPAVALPALDCDEIFLF